MRPGRELGLAAEGREGAEDLDPHLLRDVGRQTTIKWLHQHFDKLGVWTRAQAIVFALFIWFTVKLAWPMFLSKVDARTKTIADGLAVRKPIPAAFALYAAGAARIVAVSEQEIAEAMRVYYTDTHNLAEGAGAAALAGLIQERELMEGKKVGVVLSGGNVDRAVYAGVIG